MDICASVCVCMNWQSEKKIDWWASSLLEWCVWHTIKKERARQLCHSNCLYTAHSTSEKLLLCSDRKSAENFNFFETLSESVCITHSTSLWFGWIEHFLCKKIHSLHFITPFNAVDGKYFNTATQIAHLKWNEMKWKSQSEESSKTLIHLFVVEKHIFRTNEIQLRPFIFGSWSSSNRTAVCVGQYHTFMVNLFQYRVAHN